MRQGSNFDKLIGDINSFNSICSRFQTNYYLAYIHYSIDMTNEYWAEEYQYCSRMNNIIQASVDDLMYALADCSMREKLETDEFFGADYFDRYDGESHWTEEFIALKDQESELMNQYYTISSLAGAIDPQSELFYSTLGVQLEQVYVDLVKVLKEIATAAGYDSYAEYAYDMTYQRDYTPTQAGSLLGDIRSQLVEPFTQLVQSDSWREITYTTEDQTFRYVKSMAQNMGGTIQAAFATLENRSLYHISYGENKLTGAYTAFLPDYGVPFVFMSPTLTTYDHLTFAHEFGHFCNFYANMGANNSVDVAEVFSQAMELLSLFYADGGSQLETVKIADCLGAYIEQSFLADFEDRVYRMSDSELTAESIRTLYMQVAKEYDLADYLDARGYVNIPHLFTSPLYVISYVVSMDAAMQFYQLEKADSGAGLSRYENHLASTQTNFVAFLNDAGLESPFEAGHIGKLRKLFESVL